MMTNTPLFVAFSLVAFLFLCVGMLIIFHKVRRVHNMLFETEHRAKERSDNLYSQLEALVSLYYDLKPVASLPPTRGWAGSPDFLKHVARSFVEQPPDRVLECSSGTSTVVLARLAQLKGRGHVFSLEHEPKYAEKTRAELRRHQLDSFATVIDAPLVKHSLGSESWLWYDVTSVPASLDLIVIDGPPSTIQHMARYPAIPILVTRFSPGTRVLLDDADRPDERAAVQRWKDDFGLETDKELFAEKGIAALRIPAKSTPLGDSN